MTTRKAKPPTALTSWFAHGSALAWLVAGGLFGLGATIASTMAAMACDACAMLVVFATALATCSHDRGLCVRCAANVPADGPDQAARQTRMLLAIHAIWARPVRTVWAPVAVIMLPVAGVLWVVGDNPALALGVLYIAVAVTQHLIAVHRPLARWCPVCGWEGDGRPARTPHRFQDDQWTCLVCARRSADPCDCPCCQRDAERYG